MPCTLQDQWGNVSWGGRPQGEISYSSIAPKRYGQRCSSIPEQRTVNPTEVMGGVPPIRGGTGIETGWPRSGTLKLSGVIQGSVGPTTLPLPPQTLLYLVMEPTVGNVPQKMYQSKEVGCG